MVGRFKKGQNGLGGCPNPSDGYPGQNRHEKHLQDLSIGHRAKGRFGDDVHDKAQ